MSLKCSVITVLIKGSVFSAVCDFFVFLFVPQISWEPLNGFPPNSQGRHMIGPRSDEYECQGQRSKFKVTGDEKLVSAIRSPPAATEWSRLLHAARCNALSTGAACGVCLVNIFAVVILLSLLVLPLSPLGVT